MRIAINKDFKILTPSEEDMAFLKKCTVFTQNKVQDDSILDDEIKILAQKVDLEHEDMESFLDIISHYGFESPVLYRYSRERYELVLRGTSVAKSLAEDLQGPSFIPQ